MSQETRKQLGIWGILAIGFAMGFIAACSSSKPQPKAVASAAADNDASNDADKGAATARYSPVKGRARDFYTPNSEDLWHGDAHGATETSGFVLVARIGER
jgi:hypothetical protein